jgi:acetylornithine deacetylase/succinyl-diaminopimelate desuccinylase-like protein
MVPDEETGGARGSARLAATGALGRGGIGMLTAEPTGGVVWNASRGALSMQVTVTGKPAHVGLHYTGVNAFERMLSVAGELAELRERVATRRTSYNIEPDRARHSILLLGGRVEAGSNFNVVPGECVFTVDRRINPEEELAAEKQAILDVVDRARRRGIAIDADVFQEGRSAGTPESDPLAAALAASVEEVTGRRPAFELCPGLLETRFYAEAGMPALAYGPGRLEVSHGPHEYVDLDRVSECATVYALTALAVLGFKGSPLCS